MDPCPIIPGTERAESPLASEEQASEEIASVPKSSGERRLQASVLTPSFGVVDKAGFKNHGWFSLARNHDMHWAVVYHDTYLSRQCPLPSEQGYRLLEPALLS
jgi:hypothetical protein